MGELFTVHREIAVFRDSYYVVEGMVDAEKTFSYSVLCENSPQSVGHLVAIIRSSCVFRLPIKHGFILVLEP